MENTENKNKYYILFVIIALIAAGGVFYYFKYYKNNLLENPNGLPEEVLDKLGRPEKYFYVTGEITDIDVENRKLAVKIDSVDSFDGEDFSSDWRGLIRNFTISPDIKIKKMDSEKIAETNDKISSNIQEVSFTDLKEGGVLNLKVQKEELQKKNDFKTSAVFLDVSE